MTNLEVLNEAKKMLKLTEGRVASLKRQLASYDNCLVSHQWVAKVGPVYTVTSEGGFAKLSTETLPSLWTEKGVKEIMDIQKEKEVFKNFHNKPMKVEKVYFKDYYRDKIKSNEYFITSQKTIIEQLEANL